MSQDPDALRQQIAALQAQLAQAEAAQGATRRVDGGVHIGRGDFVAGDKIVLEAGETEADVRALLQAYLHALVHDVAALRLGDVDAAVDVQRQQPLQLADVYVPLHTTLEVPAKRSLAHWLARQRSGAEGVVLEKERRRVPATEALAEHRVLWLLGAPGSGKSSFGARVLLALAQAWLGHDQALQALGEHWAHGTLLPVRVVLRRFADQLPPGDAPARAGGLWAHLQAEIGASGCADGALVVKHLRRIEKRQGLMLLFDGLDECGPPAQRQRVRAAVDEFIAHASPHTRVLLTARPYAGPDKPEPARGEYLLAELDEEQAHTFIARWYQALLQSRWLAHPAEAKRKQADLQAATGRADLAVLAANPLLLTLMASLHTHRGRLPDDRADLYNESVNLLLQRWTQAKGTSQTLAELVAPHILRFDQLRLALEDLAFEVHEAGAGGRPGSDATRAADIGEGRLLRALAPLLGNSLDKARAVVDFIEQRAGLLLGQGERGGERQFSLPHRSFQEFLAACHLARSARFAGECLRLAGHDAGHWQLVLPLAARLAGPERGALAADELIGSQGVPPPQAEPPPQRGHWDRALLAGLQLREIGVPMVSAHASGRATLQRVAGWLAASLPVHPTHGGAPAPQRAYAGEVLAALGDPRFDPEALHLPADPWLGFVEVPAQPAYVLGTRPQDRAAVQALLGHKPVNDDELNDQPVAVPRFWLGRYAVTVAQFTAYVQTTGRAPGDPRALDGPNNHPVRFVDWHEALAYCQWLGEQLGQHPQLAATPVAAALRQHGLHAGLPSELQWESAARAGQPGAVFPWGNQADASRANVDGAGIAARCTVGCFEPNAWGLHDMAGNLWEWTCSRYGPYPYDISEAREGLAGTDARVLRGGRCFSFLRGARCARRVESAPQQRARYTGFRVALRGGTAG